MHETEFISNKKRFDSEGEILANYYEIFKLINISFNEYTNLNDYYNHIAMAQNESTFKRLTKYYDASVQSLDNRSELDNINKKDLLDQYILYALKKYNSDVDTINCLKSYINGNKKAITRDNNFRDNFIKYLSPNEIIYITNNKINGYVENFKTNIAENRENLYNLLQEAFIATYNKYGFTHSKIALATLISQNNGSHITNGNNNYRNRLSKYSHEEILKQINEITKGYNSNNGEDIYSYILLTLLNSKRIDSNISKSIH